MLPLPLILFLGIEASQSSCLLQFGPWQWRQINSFSKIKNMRIPIRTMKLMSWLLLSASSIAWGISSRKAVVKSVPTARLTMLFIKPWLASLKITLARKRLVSPPAKQTPITQYKAIYTILINIFINLHSK